MKVKIGTIVSTAEPLGKIMSQSMPIATSFRLKEILGKLQEVLNTYDESRKELIEKHGKDGEIKPESKNFPKFVSELEELLATETKVDIEKVAQSSLSKVEVSPTDLMALDWLIEE